MLSSLSPSFHILNAFETFYNFNFKVKINLIIFYRICANIVTKYRKETA